MQLRTLLAVLCLFLVGCSGRPPSAPSAIHPNGRSIFVRPFVSSSPSVQALVPTKTIDDIAGLVVVPTIDPGDGQYHVISRATGAPLEPVDSPEWTWDKVVYVEQSMPWIRFDQPIRISGLRAFGRYRITAMAFGRDGYLISKVGAPSSVDLTLSDDDAAIVETALPVQLMDTPFGARFNLAISLSGAESRLDRVVVQVKRQAADAPPTPVATYTVTRSQLMVPLRVSHLNAQTRYVVDIEPQVADDGPAPASQSLQIQVGQDDVLPDQEVTIAIPAL